MREPRFRTESRARLGLFQQRRDALRERVGIAGRHEQTAAARLHHFGQRARTARDHRRAARHRFGRGQAEALVERRHHHQRRALVEPHEFVGFDAAGDAQPLRRHAELRGQLARVVQRMVFVHQHQAHVRRQLRERAHQVRDALVRIRGPADAQDLARYARDLRDRAGTVRCRARCRACAGVRPRPRSRGGSRRRSRATT